METWKNYDNAILFAGIQKAAKRDEKGTLTLSTAYTRKKFDFQNGNITNWYTSNRQRRIGSLGIMLLEMDLVGCNDLLKAFVEQHQQKRNYSQILLEKNTIGQEDLQMAVTGVIADELCEVFTWEEGSLEIADTSRSAQDSTRRLAREYMHTYPVLVPLDEVAQRIPVYLEEWAKTTEKLGSLSTIFTLDEEHRAEFQNYIQSEYAYCRKILEKMDDSQSFESSISRQLGHDLSLIDGTRTIREALTEISSESLYYCKILLECVDHSYFRLLRAEELQALAECARNGKNYAKAIEYYHLVLKRQIAEEQRQEILDIISTLKSASTTPKTDKFPCQERDIPHEDIKFPGYEIVEKIGTGGMGKVYKARQESLNRFVAIKLISPKYSSDPVYIKRLELEARTMARLKHPNIVSAIDFGFHERYYYIIMEYVEGRSLLDIIDEKGMLSEKEVLDIGLAMSKALQVLQENHLVHRDLKPSNILMDKDGTPKLADLGLIKDVETEAELTKPGVAMGSPAYMSPEQVMCKDLDIRSDIYSLGVTLLHALVGKTRFNSLGIISYQISTGAEISFKGVGDFSETTEKVLVKMLQGKPEDRYQSPQQLMEDMGNAISGKSPQHAVAGKKRKKKVGVLVASVLALLLLAGVGIYRVWPTETAPKIEWHGNSVESGQAVEKNSAPPAVDTKKEEVKAAIQKGDQYKVYGEEALAAGYYEQARDFFTKAGECYAEAEKIDMTARICLGKNEEIAIAWLETAKKIPAENGRENVKKASLYYDLGLALPDCPPKIALAFSDLKRQAESKLADIERAEQAAVFTMTLEKIWLSSSPEKEVPMSATFDVRAEVHLHLEVAMKNRGSPKNVVLSLSGENLRSSTKKFLPPLTAELYHATVPLDFRKETPGNHSIAIYLQCENVSLSQEITLTLKKLAADLFYLGKNAQGYEEYRRTRDRMVMVLIPEGEFTMGDSTGEGYHDEKLHDVIMDGYLVDKYEVSNAQYAEFLSWWQSASATKRKACEWEVPPEYQNKVQNDGDRVPKYWTDKKYNAPELPVIGVDWFDAYAYAAWANMAEESGMRGCYLPSEAQWEKAAGWDQAKNKARVYPWGDSPDPLKANILEGNRGDPVAVHEYAEGVSPYGLSNMSGNVGEWCGDFYKSKYYENCPRYNPLNNEVSKYKVFRGGSFNRPAWEARVSRRRSSEPHIYTLEVGFRCARPLKK